MSDNAVRKKCEVLLGTEVTNVLKDGVRLEFDCSNCNTHFTRMNYDVKNPDAKEFFCKLQCQIDWQKKHTSKGPSTDEAWYAFYVKSVNEELSLRAMARALQMDHTVLAKHLHNKGIRMGSKSIIEKDKLKSFVRKFPDVGNVSE